MAAVGALLIVVGVAWIAAEPRIVRTDRHILGSYFGVRTGPRYVAFRRRMSVIGGGVFVVAGAVLVVRAMT